MKAVIVSLGRSLVDPNKPQRVVLSRSYNEGPRDGDFQWLSSPIFAAQREADDPFKLLAESYSLSFIATRMPLVAVAQLPSDLRNKAWRTLGSCNIVVISSTTPHLETLTDLIETKNLISIEQWTVANFEVIKKDSPQFLHLEKLDPPPIKLISGENTPRDLAHVAEELQGNFDYLWLRAQIYDKEGIKPLENLYDHLSLELKEAEKDIGDLYSAATEAKENAIDPILLQRRINKIVDRLIQTNSSLAYVVSQTHNGSNPIGQDACLISNHSLLGIGTAVKAIQQFINFVGTAFQSHSITDVIDSAYKDLTIEAYENQRAKSGLKVIDQKLQRKDADDSGLPKLAYFSSRLGFKEFQNSITAATQCLHACDSPRWTLMTLTHELLHSHIRALLASILRPASDELPEDAAKRFAEEHADNIDKRKIISLGKFSVIEFLRHSIFEYSDHYYGFAHSPDKETIEVAGARSIEGQIYRIKYSFPFINEVMVHTLDLPYFYNDDLSQYLRALWDSWSTIPGVVDKLEAYLLRSLVAAGSLKAENVKIEIITRCEGWLQDSTFSLDESFRSACNEVTDAIANLQGLGGKSVILDVIVKHLEDPKFRRRLRRLYPSNLKLGLITREFFLSSSIRSYLSSVPDKFVDFDEELGDIYKLEETELATDGISNPLRFLQDRLRRGLAVSTSREQEEEWKSAWLIHALTSLQQSN